MELEVGRQYTQFHKDREAGDRTSMYLGSPIHGRALYSLASQTLSGEGSERSGWRDYAMNVYGHVHYIMAGRPSRLILYNTYIPSLEYMAASSSRDTEMA